MKQNRTPELVFIYRKQSFCFYSGALMERFTDADSIKHNSDENKKKRMYTKRRHHKCSTNNECFYKDN